MDEQLQIAPPDPQAVVGEQEAGSRSEEVRKKINKLIKAVNTNMFDLAEYLHEVKTKAYHSEWGFTSYSEYAKSLKIKYARAYYLVDIVETMRQVGVSREEYEPVGIAKLRKIVALSKRPGLSAVFDGVPVKDLIKELTLKAAAMEPEEVTAAVEKIQGKVGDDTMEWVNLHVKRITKTNVIKPALELAKQHIGSVGQDDDGNATDATDGAAAEMIFANFLADPNYNSGAKPKETVASKLLAMLEQIKLPAETTIADLKEVLANQVAVAKLAAEQKKDAAETETPIQEA